MRRRINRRPQFIPQIYERVISEDGTPYSIVQLPPRKEFEVWLHQDDDPGKPPNRQSYFTGKIKDKYEQITIYVEGGKVHRLDGPAVLRYRHRQYFIRGLKFTKQEFWDYIKDTEYADKMFAETFGIDDGD